MDVLGGLVERAPNTQSEYRPHVERVMLLQHGTEGGRLSPLHILQTARADLGRQAQNEVIAVQRQYLREQQADPRSIPSFIPYGFAARHVRGAVTPQQILARAIEEQVDVLSRSTDPNKIHLYRSSKTLRAALALANAQADAEDQVPEPPHPEAHQG